MGNPGSTCTKNEGIIVVLYAKGEIVPTRPVTG